MKLYSYECKIGEKEGFTTENDIFHRKPFANSLTELITKSSRSLSILIDARWGEGKTTFLKMWEGELKNTGFPVIYIDAFKTDYCADPFEALSAAVAHFIKSTLPKNKELKQEFMSAAAQRLKTLGKAGLKLSGHALVHHAIGNNAPVILKEIEDAIANSLGDQIENYWQQELDEFANEEAKIEEFKKILTSIPSKLSADNEHQKPLVVIIDELDRCKPIYAISLLERIKHFMGARDVHYIFAANYEQLISCAEKIYGNSINADPYFLKFFDFRLALPALVQQAYHPSTAANYAFRLAAQSAEKFPILRQYQTAIETFTALAEATRPPLRTLERINDQIILAYSKNPPRHSFFDSILQVSIFLKFLRQRSYSNLLNHHLEFGDIEMLFEKEFSVDLGNDYSELDHQIHYMMMCWAKCIGRDIDLTHPKFDNIYSNLHIRKHDEYPQNIARQYIEQFQLSGI